MTGKLLIIAILVFSAACSGRSATGNPQSASGDATKSYCKVLDDVGTERNRLRDDPSAQQNTDLVLRTIEQWHSRLLAVAPSEIKSDLQYTYDGQKQENLAEFQHPAAKARWDAAATHVQRFEQSNCGFAQFEQIDTGNG